MGLTSSESLIRIPLPDCPALRREGSSLALVTIHDYIVVMDAVKVAELKARLSEYLRRVRRGHPVTVLDRDTPIARIVPYAPEAAGLAIRRPAPGLGKPSQVRLPPRLKTDVDIVALLMEERQRER
jgi:prevent-host-death family protein